MTHHAAPASGEPAWSFEAVRKLKALAAEGANAEAISLKLARPAAEVRAKAAAIGVTLKLDG
jgi:hypothetical protein